MSSITEGIQIPFNKPSLQGKEVDFLVDAVQSGIISGDGNYTKRCHAFLESVLGTPKALLTTNCTHALEMCALLLDLKEGDEVIMPSFTFVSTANAFALRGAKPVFADIRPDTLNIDESQLKALITPRTKAICVVHYAGVGCDMQSIGSTAKDHSVVLLEDNAHGLFGKYRGQWLGTFGSLATQSFHETKNVTCGEGGAILINDPALIERAEILREKGTNRSRFFRGQIDKYTWVDLGSSYLPSDVLAAFLLAQLEKWHEIQYRRQQIWETYGGALSDWAKSNKVITPTIPAECEQAFHMYYLLLPNLERRSAFIKHMKANGILCTFHYQPLHLSDMGLRYGGKPGDCPVTEDLSDRLVRLPFYNSLTEQDQARVIEAVLAFKP